MIPATFDYQAPATIDEAPVTAGRESRPGKNTCRRSQSHPGNEAAAGPTRHARRHRTDKRPGVYPRRRRSDCDWRHDDSLQNRIVGSASEDLSAAT